MQSEIFQGLKKAPPIVRIIIEQAARHRASGAISTAIFDQQMGRLEREELAPKGLTLLVRDLAGGRTRFLIKQRSTGTICELLEFSAEGVLETENEEPREHPAQTR